MIPFPSNTQAFVDGRGRIREAWQLFLAQFTQPPPAAQAVTPTGSPFGYKTGTRGVMYVTGGTVSDISVQRGTTVVETGITVGGVVLGIDDTILVIYSVAPTLTFMPT